MDFFSYQAGTLHAEEIALRDISEQFGTPCYVYSRAAFEHQWKSLDAAFGDYPHSICFAVKANSNIAVLNILARLGSGFDIVSEGELRRVILAGGDPAKVVYSGVAKSVAELNFAIDNGVGCINIESIAELNRVQEVAKNLDKVVAIGLRVNPDIDPQTHPYISTGMDKAKFGIAMDAAFDAYQTAAQLSHIEIHSVACHIGSQITTTAPFSDALDRVLTLVKRLRQTGIEIKQLDLGGGLGIDYQGETPPSATAYVRSMLDGLKRHDIGLPIAIEPGRYIAGNSGVLLTTVEYLKHNVSKQFALVDAGMNDLLRPALYQAYHDIVNIDEDSDDGSDASPDMGVYDIAGPVCESADVLGYDRQLRIKAGDVLAIRSAGAYGFVMAGNYNSRTRPPELMIDGDQIHIVRRRETMQELTNGEALLP